MLGTVFHKARMILYFFLPVSVCISNVLPDTAKIRVIPNDAFAVDEYLAYDVSFGPVTAGSAILKIPRILDHNGRKCYEIVSEIRSNKFFSGFFRVDDYAVSFLDTEGIFPWYFEKRLKEGKYKAERSVVFDHYQGFAFEDSDTTEMPAYSQDVLSIIYYIRTQNFDVGDVIMIDNYADKRYYPLQVKVMKRETIKVPAGKFECFYLEPSIRVEGIQEPKGKLWLWLTTDNRKLPVRIKSKIAVGSLEMELTKMRRLVPLR